MAKKKDMSFEMRVLGGDPAIKRLEAIKALLVKRGHGPSLHSKDCICLACIEGKLNQIIPIKK